MVQSIDVQSLLTLPEGETLDFKAKAYDLSDQAQKVSLAKDLTCLWNTPREGNAYLILGVKKYRDGSFSLWGIDPNSIDDADLQAIASSLLESCPRFSYQVAMVDGVHLGLIVIPPGHGRALPAAPKKTQSNGFVEGRLYFRHGSQNVPASMSERAQIWSWFLGRDDAGGLRPSPAAGGPSQAPPVSPESPAPPAQDSDSNRSLDPEHLLGGPIEALGLTPVVEQAERLRDTSPADAARLYEVVAATLRDHFPGFADRYDQSRATALKSAGDHGTSHDVLMDLAIRDLFEKAEPHPAPGVMHELRELGGVVDEVRRVRGAAVTAFARWHEAPNALQELAEHFDELGPDDTYSPYVAVLLAEAALADREPQVVADRAVALRHAAEHDQRGVALRVQVALADAGVLGEWPTLAGKVESNRFTDAEQTYVCLRAGRWYAWNGQLASAERLYRRAVELGASAGLDLDVENALWSLTRLYAFSERSDELLRMNQLAMSIQGSSSHVAVNSRTRERAYRYLATGKLPDAHLWSRHRLLESIRSGCLTDELESHAILARIYRQAGERLAALDHAVLGGADALVKAVASELDAWGAVIADAARSQAPWVRPVALAALERVGDLAPRDVSRSLARDLVDQLEADTDDPRSAPALFRALWSIVLEATDDDLERLMRMLIRAAPRDPGRYLLTDPGVGLLAGRLYRFRPALRQRAASVLAEMALGGHTNDWVRALEECGEDIDELIVAFKRVAGRQGTDLVGPLSDLEHPNAATRILWSNRLQFVEDHPLGERSEYRLLSRYDVPRQFLEEQEVKVVDRYVQKLVEIGRDRHEAIVNRAAALSAGAAAVELLSTDRRGELFGVVRPLTDPETRVSELDEYQTGTSHPLSRFQISLGNVADIRAAALHFLARSALAPVERSDVVETALSWLGAEYGVLQQTAASVLTLPYIEDYDVRSVDLAAHPNPWVRRAAVALPSMQERPDLETLERLASDSYQLVRIGVVYALENIRDSAPEAYNRIGSHLRDDQSGIVRAIAAAELAPPA